MKTIRALRQQHGWTQYELALVVGMHPQAVYLRESGRRMPQVPQMRKLGTAFRIRSDEIDLVHNGEPDAGDVDRRELVPPADAVSCPATAPTDAERD
jgi:transcriptional regulator with XRE-family HTH domain